MKRALVLIFDNVEEIEALAPVDILRRGGVEVSMASMGPVDKISGRSGIKISPDSGKDFESVEGELFDAVVVPGGRGIFDWLECDRLSDFLQRHFRGGRVLAAICAAPLLFHRIGILEGRRRTAHFSVAEEIGGCSDLPVVRDGEIITSKGAGTAVDFALEILSAVEGEKRAKDVAKDICFIK